MGLHDKERHTSNHFHLFLLKNKVLNESLPQHLVEKLTRHGQSQVEIF